MGIRAVGHKIGLLQQKTTEEGNFPDFTSREENRKSRTWSKWNKRVISCLQFAVYPGDFFAQNLD